jgi:hypothetical protein
LGFTAFSLDEARTLAAGLQAQPLEQGVTPGHEDENADDPVGTSKLDGENA